jgi:glycosyltransferase involved in cell wall biosynthesis
MPRKRILMACPNYWRSPFQVGSHHLAREFARAGWDVAYLSDPVTPWHLAHGWNPDLRRRVATYLAGGERDLGGRLWTYTPAAAAVGHNRPLLRGAAVHRHWHRWTLPNVVRKVREQGFGTVDLLYIDSITQPFWLDAIRHKHAVYRLTDFSPHFARFTAAARRQEEEMARRADLVLYPSPVLKDYVSGLGARQTLYFPNGVELEHFATAHPYEPPEYRGLTGPIAVYVGVILPWFHFEWIRHAARALPHMTFVLIGPDTLARRELAGLPNVLVLGRRDYALVPAYLQRADVGLMPFDVSREPETVECLNPLKMYQYFAAGLPVVASEWQALRQLGSPAVTCASAEDFAAALQRVTDRRPDRDALRRYAARFDWRVRLQELLARLDVMTPGQGDAAYHVAA